MSVLALHGQHGTAEILRRQMRPLAAVLPPTVELTFVDAPSLALGDIGWWRDGDMRGWERTLDWARTVTAEHHFDGVIGFSQGAALAGMLVAAQESTTPGAAAPAGLEFGFAVIISGFIEPADEASALLRRPLRTPSLHVMSAVDTVVPVRASERLAACFTAPRIVCHGGGHVIPTDHAALAEIVSFVSRRGEGARPMKEEEFHVR
ncbi:alpha/beta hydrolase family protein [Microbacterium gorillae]|uniref:hypothetical protein n=1 Tax=Microbacterium gorillae TaxID=1231063 RepID=UPI0018A7FC18|nr:hypothetical protein [Microbacterium gorillae]